jgi:hypothetical protein
VWRGLFPQFCQFCQSGHKRLQWTYDNITLWIPMILQGDGAPWCTGFKDLRAVPHMVVCGA